MTRDSDTAARRLQKNNIGFVGAGNMATSLIGGLLEDDFPRSGLRASDPDPARGESLSARLGVRVDNDNTALVNWADIVVLAVKPQKLREAARALAGPLQKRRPLVVSIAAGVRSRDILRWAGGSLALIRVMPNTPALVKTGMSALFAAVGTSEAQRECAQSILAAVGETLWVDKESDMDAVTAVSGSGPAYFFLLMEALQQAGESLGLDGQTARRLTQQTALGAARMALDADDGAAALRTRVTSPGGTTERALNALEAGDFRRLVHRAVADAASRAGELADTLSRES